MRIRVAVSCCVFAVFVLFLAAGGFTSQYPPAHDVALSRLFPPDALARLLLPPDSWHPFPRASEREAWQALPESLRTRILGLAEEARRREVDFEHTGFEWLEPGAAIERLTFRDAKKMLERADKLLKG